MESTPLPTTGLVWTTYFKRRKDDLEVGTVCEGCKAQTVPFAANRIWDLEAEGLLDEVEEYRQLAGALRMETGS